jgi:hypothetical protein
MTGLMSTDSDEIEGGGLLATAWARLVVSHRYRLEVCSEIEANQ